MVIQIIRSLKFLTLIIVRSAGPLVPGSQRTKIRGEAREFDGF
jgi:hypothetical protein